MSDNRSFSRRHFLKVSALSAAGAALAACAPRAAQAPAGGAAQEQATAPAAPPPAAIKLTVVLHPNWKIKGDPLESTGKPSVQYAKMFPAFKERNPNVELVPEELLGDTEGRTKYLLQCRQGTQADVIMLDGFWVAEFAALGCTKPLDLGGVLDQGLLSDYFDAFKVNYKGKVHALIPGTAFNSMLWYRKDLLEAAGFKEPPKDWDEFKLAAEKLTKKSADGKVEQYGLVSCGAKSEHTSVINLSFYWQGEETFVTPDNQPAFDNQTSKDIFALFADIAKNGWIAPEFVNMQYEDVQKAFIAEKAAMMLHGSWLTSGMDALAPNLKGKIGLAPNPVYPRTKKRGTNAGGWSLAITTKDDTRIKAAADFLYVICGGMKDLFKEMLLEGGSLPTTKSLADDADFAKNEWQKTVLSELPNAHTRPAVEIYPDASLEWSQAFQEAATGKKLVDQALKEATDRVVTIAKEKGYIQ